MSRLLSLLAAFAFAATSLAADPWLTIPGGEGPGKGKKIVLISGDEEYRSEEVMPQLGKILATHHGFDCTVLFAIDPADGAIQPNVKNNIPGLEKLKDADLMILFTRFRDLPDDQMKHVVEYVESGKPIIGLRTATHAFALSTNKKYSRYDWGNKDKQYSGGFGRQVLGETWVAHHGSHGKEGTRGIVAKGEDKNPILKGIDAGTIFGTTDVYTAKPPADCQILVLGEVTETLKPDSKAVAGKKNEPMMPIAWTRNYKTETGKTAKIFTTTMGCADDLSHEGTRRMLVNASYSVLGMEEKIADKSKVDLVGEYKPTPFGTKKNDQWKPGTKPEDLAK